MARYIDADAVHKFVEQKVAEGKDGWSNGVPYEWAYALTVIDMQPTADVVPKSEVAEMLRLMFDDDCACNYNGNDEWLPSKCKYAETECPMPKDRLGCWMEFVEHGLAKLKKKCSDCKHFVGCECFDGKTCDEYERSDE